MISQMHTLNQYQQVKNYTQGDVEDTQNNQTSVTSYQKTGMVSNNTKTVGGGDTDDSIEANTVQGVTFKNQSRQLRPITRDIKQRQGQRNDGVKEKVVSGKDEALTTAIHGFNTSSALSGTCDNFDARNSLTGFTGAQNMTEADMLKKINDTQAFQTELNSKESLPRVEELDELHDGHMHQTFQQEEAILTQSDYASIKT